MERREVVNGSKEYDPARRYDRPGEWTFSRPDIEPITQVEPTQFPTAPTSTQSPSFRFPAAQAATRPVCLYLGPAGERCDSPALDSGFCPRHQLNSAPTALRDESRARKKKAAATVGIVAMLWPLIEEVVRHILRLLK
jgi:hypothetical protein